MPSAHRYSRIQRLSRPGISFDDDSAARSIRAAFTGNHMWERFLARAGEQTLPKCPRCRSELSAGFEQTACPHCSVELFTHRCNQCEDAGPSLNCHVCEGFGIFFSLTPLGE